MARLLSAFPRHFNTILGVATLCALPGVRFARCEYNVALQPCDWCRNGMLEIRILSYAIVKQSGLD